jgi:hypothetical protein
MWIKPGLSVAPVVVAEDIMKFNRIEKSLVQHVTVQARSFATLVAATEIL